MFALNEKGYKRLIDLSSSSFLLNNKVSEPFLDLKILLDNKNEGVSLFTGTINGLFGQMFNKGKFTEIKDLYLKLKSNFDEGSILKFKDMVIKMN